MLCVVVCGVLREIVFWVGCGVQVMGVLGWVACELMFGLVGRWWWWWWWLINYHVMNHLSPGYGHTDQSS